MSLPSGLIAPGRDAIRAVAERDWRPTPALRNAQRRASAGLWSAKKVVFLGDSTTSNATDLYNRLAATYHAGAGGLLEGVTSGQLVNQGNNGASLAAYLAGSATYKVGDAIAAAGDLYVISYGINDVRLNTSTEDQLVTNLTTLVTTLRAALPDADFVLRIPNSLITTDVGSHGYVSGITPQAATDRMWNAYKRLENKWPNVVVFDAQTLVFGRIALALSSYMTDQLHPSTTGYYRLADALAAVIGWQEPFNANAATVARALDSASPMTYYPRAVEDPAYFDPIASGEWVAQGSGFLDFSWPGTAAAQIAVNDYVQMGPANTPFRIAPGATFAASGNNTRITGLGAGNPTQTMGGGLVKVYRPKYGDANIETYFRQTVTFPYRRIGQVVAVGNGFIDIGAHKTEVARSGAAILAKDWANVVAADTLIVVGQSPVLLTGATFAASGNNLRISKAGTDFTPYGTGGRCAIVGNHAYE